ncbi:M56 family metallopeptidase [Candidatus Merdisoma sp. JLR.KK006]|uniref:M56 family metallopeptidase n=1 Tax=Candidatus Merdisoma sp. JLR.KK006 TaxID=3112626 RepID=UPI002FF1F083
MDRIFLSLLNRSIAAGWLILAVLMLRLLLKKAPKWIPCILWGIAAVRLICPFSPVSAFSLIPSGETLSRTTVMYAQSPEITSGVSVLNRALNPVIRGTFAPAPGASVNPLQVWMFLGGILWAVGLTALLLYALESFLRLHIRLRESVPLERNIRLCDAIESPFILGIVRPRIYLPSGIKEEEMKYVLAHEHAHLKRKDHWWKFLGYFLAAIYWFHPLVWAAYILFCRDMELACDERVIKGLDIEGKKAYSHALVTCSVSKRTVMVCPVAFGEVGVKKRVKAVLHYQKPAFWVILAAIFACVIVAVCFLTNPRKDTYEVRIVIPAGSEGEIYYSDAEISPYGNKITLWAGEGLSDTEVVLMPLNSDGEWAPVPVYMTPGMPVSMEAAKDVWYRIGVNVSNPSTEEKDVYVKAEGIKIRIASGIEDNVTYDIIPMVMVNGKYYYDTGRTSSKTEHSTEMDGEITSAVDGSQKPTENNQSNFGTGYGYQWGEDDTIEVHIDGKWVIFEYRSGDGSLIRYGDQWYSQGDLSKETIEWLYWYNGLTKEEQMAVSAVPSDLYDLIYTGNESDLPAKTEDANGDPLNEAIQKAILEENASSYGDTYDLACCDFLALATEVMGPAAEDTKSSIVAHYGWALYQEYQITNEGIKDVGGSHIPVVLTFEEKDGNYELKEYWKPREGSYFVSDIRSKFPAEIAEDGIDSQKFGISQIQSCYRQAVEFSGLDTDKVIERLLDAICSGPNASSNPRDYMEAHFIEYRELLYYGEYTLRYCLNRFRQGNETGLEGKIMALICEELMQTKGTIPADAQTAETGQFWYDTLYAHGSNRVDPYLE